MAVVELKDQVQEGLDKLITQWKDKPVVVGLLTSYLENIQQVENTFFQLLEERSLETAQGVHLDSIGLLVGELREARLDDGYRKAIKLRIAINKSDGTEPVIRELIKQLTNSETVTITDEFPAAISIKLEGALVDVSSEDILEISNVLATTITARLEFGKFIDPPFVFEDDDSGEGFADASTGGLFGLITDTGLNIEFNTADILVVKNDNIIIDFENIVGGYLADITTVEI